MINLLSLCKRRDELQVAINDDMDVQEMMSAVDELLGVLNKIDRLVSATFSVN